MYIVKTNRGYVYMITNDGICFTQNKEKAISLDFDPMDCILQLLELSFPGLKPEIFLK